MHRHTRRRRSQARQLLRQIPQPQQKRQKEIKKFRDSLDRGSKIVTAGGIYGTIKEVRDTYFIVEVSNGVSLRVDSVISTGSAVQGTSVSYSAQWPNASQRQQLKGWVDDLTTPALTDRTIRSKVMDQMVDCCNGKITPQQAADAALRSLNLYLSE